MEFKVEKEINLSEQIFDARYHPTSQNDLIAAVTIAGDVHLLEDGIAKSKIRKHHKGSSIRKVRFTREGHMVTLAKTVKIYDLNSEQTLHTLKRDDGKRTVFYSVTPFTSHIISAGDDDGGIFLWDTRTPENPIFSSYDCEQYISDIDGVYEPRKLMVCTSGEGTLTAYDLRANKMIEPQSELFEAGFQCVKMVDLNKKVVIGGEDGSVYVFNQNEWAHTSGKFAISNDLQNRGNCSVDCLELLPDQTTFLTGCSDGKLRSVTLWPHQILTENVFCRRSPLESIHVNPKETESKLVLSGENYLNIINFEEKSDDESGNEEECTSTVANEASADRGDAACEKPPTHDQPQKKLKTETDDYLQIFKK